MHTTSPIVWRLTVLMVLALAALTAADILITLHALQGDAVEFNPYARDGSGGIRTGFLIAVNCIVLLPLSWAFWHALQRAETVPPVVLRRWWRHIFDLFTVHPRSTRGRERSPLRLASAAMTMVTFKIVIVAGNLLVVSGNHGPASLLAEYFSGQYTGVALWRAAYFVMIVPCYAAAFGLAAHALAAVQAEIPIGQTA